MGGDADSLIGRLDDVNFHIFAMKEPDYVMSLMSSYGTNSRVGRETRREWKEKLKLQVSFLNLPAK